MARRDVVILEDDLEGGPADETVKFALDGVQYEIDLSQKNAARLRESAAADREQNKAIRTWAKRKGRNISDRGRIPQEIVDEYNADAGR